MHIFGKNKAFTLVEVLIACIIMVVFMIGVYNLFIGGSKTAGKAQWINSTVEELRNTLAFLGKQIRSSTYPTTIYSDTFFDPCDNPDKSVAQEFYLKILKDGDEIMMPSSGKIKIMSWVVCQPERPPQPGKIIKNELYLEHKLDTRAGPVGNLRVVSKAYSFTTDAKTEHAKSGKLELKPLKQGNLNKVLTRDVQFVKFSVAGTIPPEKPVDFFPISVTIHTLYPKDEKVFKESSIMATPQVGIDTL